MKFIQKTHLSLALAMAIGGVAIAASTQAVAAPQNPNIANGGLQAAGAVAGTNDNSTPYVAHNGLGQALIAPYYTTRANQRTAINIMNTSGDTLAVKVVLREGKYSRDVLNFYILMSPYDAWTGYLSSSSGTPTLHRTDDSCVAGAFGTQDSSGKFTAMSSKVEALSTRALVDTNDADSLNEGYITIIAAGKVNLNYTTPSSIPGEPAQVTVGRNYAGYIVHDTAGTGDPVNCQSAVAPFTAPRGTSANLTTGARGNAAIDPLFDPLLPGENPLKGNLVIMNPDDGIAGGTQATAIANFNQSGNDLVTAQQFPYFNEPSLASSFGICSGSDAGLTLIENALRANSLINEWANNTTGANNAQTDWVVTLPTKGFRTDPSTTDANALGFCRGTVSAGTAATMYDGNGGGRVNGLPIYYTMGAVDREEKMPTIAPIPSPSTDSRALLPNEVNVISFKPAPMTGPLSSKLVVNADLASMIGGTPNGWAELKFDAGPAGVPLNQRLAGAPTTYDVAAIGFVYKVRNQPGSATTNFGQIIDHSAKQFAVIPSSSATPAALKAAADLSGLKGPFSKDDDLRITAAVAAANAAATAAANEARNLAGTNPLAAIAAANAAKAAAQAVIDFSTANPTKVTAAELATAQAQLARAAAAASTAQSNLAHATANPVSP